MHASLHFWDQSCSLLTCTFYTVESTTTTTTKLTSCQIFSETLKPQGHMLVTVLQLWFLSKPPKSFCHFTVTVTHQSILFANKGLFLWREAPAYYGSTVVGCKQLTKLLHHSQQPPVCSGHREISLNLRPVQPCHLVF